MQRVLFIQDRSTGYTPLRMALEGLGLEVHCETPTQFVASGRWDEPLDLLVLDLDVQELPEGMRGWDVLRKFWEYNHSGTEPKVVVMSRFNDVGSRLLADICAVSAYVLKPTLHDEIVLTVQRVLRLRGVSTP